MMGIPIPKSRHHELREAGALRPAARSTVTPAKPPVAAQ
jgi:hypothetical protein